MKQVLFTVLENKLLARDLYIMRLAGDTSAIAAPGQFIDIRLDGFFLRRPISVCDWDGETATIIYKTVGDGTRKLSACLKGETLDALTGLGNGYALDRSGTRPLLLGGGAGVPPLYGLCRRLIAEEKQPTVVLGFGSAADAFFEDEFRALGANVYVTTADGSRGLRGFVTDAMKGLESTYFYACGPEPMLRAVYAASRTEGEFSFEARMGCGFGACMGCSCKTKFGDKRLCKDGPVLRKEEILW